MLRLPGTKESKRRGKLACTDPGHGCELRPITPLAPTDKESATKGSVITAPRNGENVVWFRSEPCTTAPLVNLLGESK
jgi:hypothetical protein